MSKFIIDCIFILADNELSYIKQSVKNHQKYVIWIETD